MKKQKYWTFKTCWGYDSGHFTTSERKRLDTLHPDTTRQWRLVTDEERESFCAYVGRLAYEQAQELIG